jgi:hypothetical protein
MKPPIITVDEHGKVVLSDADLIEIEATAALSAGGDDPETINTYCSGNNASCLNKVQCRDTHNNRCTNWNTCPLDDGIG